MEKSNATDNEMQLGRDFHLAQHILLCERTATNANVVK